ncbi:MAG: hypothetical protein DI630_00825 [Gordonia sp. (in: high G+C Gram-positive bacteria)]|nr:MAG: hypothetical protein DI630_00825 [Gordonia sp. (in: high G+C Gram-positive bacteria)]
MKYTEAQIAAADGILETRQELARRIRSLAEERHALTKPPVIINARNDAEIAAANLRVRNDYLISHSDLHVFGKNFFKRMRVHTWMDVYLDWSWEGLAEARGWGVLRLDALEVQLRIRGITLRSSIPCKVHALHEFNPSYQA